MVIIKLTKKQVERVLAGLPAEIKKLNYEFVNTPTEDVDNCNDILGKIQDLKTMKMLMENTLSEIYSLELQRDNMETKRILKAIGLGGLIPNE